MRNRAEKRAGLIISDLSEHLLMGVGGVSLASE